MIFIKSKLKSIRRRLSILMTELGTIKARQVMRHGKLTNPVFDFTDIEYLCNHSVQVKMTSSNGTEEFNCWVDEVTIKEDGKINVIFSPRVEYPQI